jgi:monovalent cation/hydrogen antiporter
MIDGFPFYLVLVVAIVLLVILAKKINVAYPVLLVIAGLLISFIPGIPSLHIKSELIFVIFLPPLLYDAAWQISWKELWRWRRIISSFAFIVVFFTAFAVAVAANQFIPGFSLALGFLLGGIVSPPDAISAGAIMKFVSVPKRVSSILEGESLLNDASSLIIFRFAMIAAATGQFVWLHAALSFTWMVIGGILAGLLVGVVLMKMHKFLPTDANMDIVLTIVTPYAMYVTAEEIGSSGVLAVVSGGLLLSNKRYSFLASSSRLRSISFWESLSFLLNGLVFMLIGLDLPQITGQLGNVSLAAAIGYGLFITAALIITRIVAVYGAVVVTLIARNFITVADPNHPGYRSPFIIGWAGMRGVVSLASALSIPEYMSNGAAFPQRNLILFITFIVILTTLLLQGLTLPLLIKKFELSDPDQVFPDEVMYKKIKLQLDQVALNYITTKYAAELDHQPSLQLMVSKWKNSAGQLDEDWVRQEHRDIYLDVLKQQRFWLIEANAKKHLANEEIFRRHLSFLDLEEEKMSYI